MGILDSIGTYLGDEENRLRLASGFQGLSMNPNAANIQQGFQNRLGELQEDRKLKTAKELADSKLQLQTSRALQLIGDEYSDVAQAIQGGFMTPTEGMAEVMRRRNLPEKDRKTIKGADGYNYYVDTGDRVLSGVEKTVTDTALMRNFDFYVSKGKTAEEAMTLLRAGNTINMGGNKFLQGVGQGAADIMSKRQIQAQSSVGTIKAINELRPLLQENDDGTGGVFAGPLSTQQMLIARLGQKLGVGGDDDAQILTNTTAAMQKLASLELTAAQGMRGQGQITENERKLIKRAAAGELATMTAPEVNVLLDGLDKLARQGITEYTTFLDTGFASPDAQQFKSIYQVVAPPAYVPSGVTVKRVR